MTSSWRRLTAVLAVLLLFAAACGDDDGSSAPTTQSPTDTAPADGDEPETPEDEPLEMMRASIQLNWVRNVQHFGVTYAQMTGITEANGLDLDILQGGGQGIDPIQSVANGQTEFGVSSGENVITAVSNGLDIVPVGATFYRSPTAVTCRADRVTTIDELSTARIGVRAVSEATFDTFVAKNDLNRDTMDIVPLAGSDVASIIAGAIDCQYTSFSTNEPGVMARNGVEPTVFLLGEYGLPQQGDVYFTSSEVLANNPELVDRFVASVTEAWEVFLDDPDAAAQWVYDENLFDGVELDGETDKARAQVELIDGPEGVLALYPDIWAETAENLLAVGSIENEVDIDELLRYVLAP